MPNVKTVVPYAGTEEQEERLREVIRTHKGQPGATMPVLQAAQEIFGYLPEEVQIMVAEGLDIPLTEAQPQGEVSDQSVPGHGLLSKWRLRYFGSGPAAPGYQARLHHAGRKVLSGRLPLYRRLRPGPCYDDQQRCVRPPYGGSGGEYSG